MIKIVYFSGTGNTAYIAEQIKQKLQNQPVECFPIEVDHDLEGATMIYLGFPVYACDMPSLMTSYINRLPDGHQTAVKLFITYGLFAGKTLARAKQLLERKGYHVLNGYGIQMPGTDGLAFLEKEGKTAKKMMAKGQVDLESLHRWVSDHHEVDYKLGFDLMGRMFGGAMRAAEKHMKPKYYADERCILCRKCVRICPVKNITCQNEEILFSDKCILCMRCIHQCPTEAIQIGKKTINKLRYKGPDGHYQPPIITRTEAEV